MHRPWKTKNTKYKANKQSRCWSVVNPIRENKMADLDDGEDGNDFFRSFADVPLNPPEKRDMCSRCKRPLAVCLCAHFPSHFLQISTTIHVLQHPREESRLLTTVPLLEACLSPDKIVIRRGRRFHKNDWPDLHELLDKPTTLLLYPGPTAENIKTLGEPPLGENYDIIVLDGTWRQAKDIFHNNPFLCQARQVQLVHDHISEYVIRTQPNSKSLCTVEAIALSLSILEKNEEIAETLIRPLRALCKIQLEHGAVVHFNKENEDEIMLRAKRQERSHRKKMGGLSEKER
ncbi:tRNA-uridine aminocarboxypropyltransferase 2-like [Pocillopora verrucosa]|uniref:tRNA-uridine aminocarboxypropyltransferase 2-like n=1 Tax=Pocillopora verrucosa TaxID=203993 RepID=UPI00333E6669